MYDKPFAVEIIAPEKVVFSGQATSVSAPGVEGGFQVLHSHAPLLALLEPGRVKVRNLDGTESFFAVGGGVAEVLNNHVALLVESAERPDEIDVHRAEEARDRAKKRLSDRQPEIDMDRARLSLARAMNRLHLADKA